MIQVLKEILIIYSSYLHVHDFHHVQVKRLRFFALAVEKDGIWWIMDASVSLSASLP